MKNILLVAFLSLLSFSCSKDNNDNLAFEFEGKWTLYNVSCSCEFTEDTDFSTHKITFDEAAVTIENSEAAAYLSNEEGDYTVEENVITFASGKQYTFVVKLDRLFLTYGDDAGVADDEITLEYIRG